MHTVRTCSPSGGRTEILQDWLRVTGRVLHAVNVDADSMLALNLMHFFKMWKKTGSVAFV